MAPPVDEPRDFDVAIVGATGFVGTLICENACRRYLSMGSPAKFVFAGRSLPKLEALRDRLCAQFALSPNQINLAEVDTKELPSLISLAKRTRVIATTVGPFLEFGEPVIHACIEAKTHYCDITGELPFVASMHQQYGAIAESRGVKLVSFCGFDSVPSDLTVMLVQDKALELTGSPCPLVKMAVTSLRGGVSGATIASGVNMMGHTSMTDPYYLCTHATANPPNSSQLVDQPRVCAMNSDRDFGYGTFFVMSRVNENVVRWTNALLGWRYGIGFKYYEFMACRYNFLSAMLLMGATYASLLLVAFPFTRWLGLWTKIIPSAGEGPSRQIMDGGYFRCEALGRVQKKGGKSEILIRSSVSSDFGDPGYKESAKMLLECALALSLDIKKCTKLTGCLSPVAGIGPCLVERLNAAGIKCEVSADSNSA